MLISQLATITWNCTDQHALPTPCITSMTRQLLVLSKIIIDNNNY